MVQRLLPIAIISIISGCGGGGSSSGGSTSSEAQPYTPSSSELTWFAPDWETAVQHSPENFSTFNTVENVTSISFKDATDQPFYPEKVAILDASLYGSSEDVVFNESDLSWTFTPNNGVLDVTLAPGEYFIAVKNLENEYASIQRVIVDAQNILSSASIVYPLECSNTANGLDPIECQQLTDKVVGSYSFQVEFNGSFYENGSMFYWNPSNSLALSAENYSILEDTAVYSVSKQNSQTELATGLIIDFYYDTGCSAYSVVVGGGLINGEVTPDISYPVDATFTSKTVDVMPYSYIGYSLSISDRTSCDS